jgi:UDP-glucose 4-epimerase
MATILVTGGAGYVGGVCCSGLVDLGHRVTVVDDLSAGHAAAVPQGARLHIVDVGDRRAMREVFASDHFDVVFHFAAKALIPESVSNPGIFFDANVASGIALLEETRAAGIKKFVFSSSAAVYGNPRSTPIGEDHEKNPVNPYGETKLMLEHALRWYASSYDWMVVAFRYFNACGGTSTAGEDHRPETHIIPLLLQAACGERESFEIFGSDYQTPDGTCLRDYVHVLDIADAHIRALHAPERPGMTAYNIGTGTSFSVRHICQVVERIAGTKILTRDGARRVGDPAILCADPKRLITQLDWQPRFSDIEEIIRSAWEWKQKHPVGYASRDAELVPHSG